MPYRIPELPLEPPETKVDGVYVCAICKETIPGGESCWHILNSYICESCMEEVRETAPYQEEVAPYYDREEDYN